MSKLNFSLQSFLIFMGLGVGLNPVIAAAPHQAETSVSIGTQLSLNLPDTDRGQPGSTLGGGKRGGCINRETKVLFRPVLPVNNEGEAIATTVSTDLNFWWYMPENDAVRAEFSVFAQNNDADALVHYQVINDINQKSGLLQVELPDNTLKPGQSYWWDLTLACDEIDRSADIYLFGSVERQNLAQMVLPNDAALLDKLTATLKGSNSYLSLSSTEAQELASALDTNRSSATVKMVSDRLLTHFTALRSDYAKLNQSLAKAQQNPGINRAEIQSLEMQRGEMVLELAQLSAFYGVWGDTVDFLAEYRADYPNDWQSLLKALFPADDPSTVEEEDLIIRLLSQS
ncbi:protein of unknown function DUF928 [[Leptolyngbya] sp. PCC 7376]|uniref:DUF928 domain-containing protein n=1 Tax=[Leptolyngbya] sp. PCC 7376 TaxID=111781 RepID=UPI00029EFCE2|nr:DUF928 domain-containing protein [[Leptolyngbya] sp. PCC 7376]AFY39254.1 protein of unknown function DUF928 [[Leptolyngbya] sp. PCC 7376]